jgi:hypothetical protein
VPLSGLKEILKNAIIGNEDNDIEIWIEKRMRSLKIMLF